MSLADGIVIGVLALIIVLIFLSLRKNRKKGGHCPGCSGCCSHTGCPSKEKKAGKPPV